MVNMIISFSSDQKAETPIMIKIMMIMMMIIIMMVVVDVELLVKYLI